MVGVSFTKEFCEAKEIFDYPRPDGKMDYFKINEKCTKCCANRVKFKKDHGNWMDHNQNQCNVCLTHRSLSQVDGYMYTKCGDCREIYYGKEYGFGSKCGNGCFSSDVTDSLDIYPVMDVLKDFPDSKYIFNLIKNGSQDTVLYIIYFSNFLKKSRSIESKNPGTVSLIKETIHKLSAEPSPKIVFIKPTKQESKNSRIFDLKKELHDMCTGSHKETGAFHEKNSSGNLRPKERVREIGRLLNDLGGFNLMSDVGLTITGTNQRELEFAWSGIGQWQA